MAKKIKLTERQVKLLKDLQLEGNKGKVLRITESQYNRLFKADDESEEDLGVETTMAAGSSGAFEAPMGGGGSPIKKNFPNSPSAEINEDDLENNGPQFQHDCDKCEFLGNYNGQDLYFCNQGGNVTTVIARFGDEDWEYESGLRQATPDGHPLLYKAKQLMIQKYPSLGRFKDEEVIETTTSGDASGAYEQPKIWAKNPENSRHSKKPMYPNGKIVDTTKFTHLDNLYAEVAKKTGKSVNEVKEIITKSKK